MFDRGAEVRDRVYRYRQISEGGTDLLWTLTPALRPGLLCWAKSQLPYWWQILATNLDCSNAKSVCYFMRVFH
jgi:hypothetical protein